MSIYLKQKKQGSQLIRRNVLTLDPPLIKLSKMCIKFVYFVLFISSVSSRYMPRYADLDDEDQHLLRAAYETPSYDHDEYEEDNEMPMGKLDLLKDGLWAVKAKIKELKAFNKALAANFLATKLKVKELIAASLVLKKHTHGEEKKKPAYNYPAPSYQPQYAETQYAPQYAEPQYAPQLPQHQHDPYYGH